MGRTAVNQQALEQRNYDGSLHKHDNALICAECGCPISKAEDKSNDGLCNECLKSIAY